MNLLIVSACHKPYMAYVDRLKYLCLNSLELRRLHSNQTGMFKIVKDFGSPSLKYSIRFSTVTCTV